MNGDDQTAAELNQAAAVKLRAEHAHCPRDGCSLWDITDFEVQQVVSALIAVQNGSTL